MYSRSAKLICGRSVLMPATLMVLSDMRGPPDGSFLTDTPKSSRHGDHRRNSREANSENQTPDRRVGRLTARRSNPTIQCLRQPQLPVQSQSTTQARTVLSDQFQAAWQKL